jgi:calcium-dependent protein kinase
LKRLEQELEILESLDHPNLVRYHATFTDPSFIHIVMELCKGGEVFERIHKNGCLSEQITAKVIYQVLTSLKHLHANGICHRDLKPENIMFIDTNVDEIKIIDFGLSKKYCISESNFLHSVVGTPYYVAPEVLSQQYDQRCDIWSVGVIMYIMLCGYPPFNGKTSREVIKKIKSGIFEFEYDDWSLISMEAKDLIKHFLIVDPEKRITIEQAMQHPWIRGLMKKNPSHNSPVTSQSTLCSSVEDNDKNALQRL